MAIARLGDSSVPQDAFIWADTLSPRGGDETMLLPQWTLDIQPDGSVKPRLPDNLQFRDGEQIRPVCPFFEIWALMGEPGSANNTWQATPLTPALLQAHGATTNDVLLHFNAINAKAARRRNNPDLRFGTFPPLELRANQLTVADVLGVSPPGIAQPMIPVGRNIPLGKLRFIQSLPQPATGTTPWADKVNVEILRFRFTPPNGRFYGPPAASLTSTADRRQFVAVPTTQAFLNADADWHGQPTRSLDAPADTYDTVDGSGTGPSLGVVDDTFDARITIELSLPNRPVLTAEATLFVGPPDYAPDHRPFLTLADEINDRAAEASARSDALSPLERDQWRQDHAKTLDSTEMTNPIASDGLDDDRAMGARDKLRNHSTPTPIAAAIAGVDPLPLSAHARSRHRTLSDLVELKRFVRENPERLKQLIRPAFEVPPGEGPGLDAAGNPHQELTSMQMPPFMRNSNAQPLTLSAWQYELLLNWASDTETASVALAAVAPAVTPMSDAAAARMDQVLRRVNAGHMP